MADSRQRTTESYPAWTPADLSEWLDRIAHKFPERKVTLYRRLATDDRMREVWAWYERIRNQLHRYQGGSPVSFVLMVEQAMRMPGKPGNMPPKKRTQYLESVRHHADALINLLNDTRFDCAWDGATEVDAEDDNAEGKIGEHVLSAQSFVNSEPGGGGDIPVAYVATPDGLYKLPWDYPHSHLSETLYDLCLWAQDDDYWGGAG